MCNISPELWGLRGRVDICVSWNHKCEAENKAYVRTFGKGHVNTCASVQDPTRKNMCLFCAVSAELVKSLSLSGLVDKLSSQVSPLLPTGRRFCFDK